MKNYVKKTSFILLAGLLSFNVWAAGSIEQLTAFVNNTRSATGGFSQVTVGKNGKTGKTQSGQFVFQRPGKFRWHTTAPFQQMVIADGKQLLQYDEDLNQLTKRSVTQSLGASPAALLFGKGNLQQNFTLTELASAEGLDWVQAIPKQNNAGFERVNIGLKNNIPVQLLVYDAFGQSTKIQLTTMKVNAPVPASAFAFTPPAGVDVVTMQ